MFENYRQEFNTNNSQQDTLIRKLIDILERDTHSEHIKVRLIESIGGAWNGRDMIRVELTDAPEAIGGETADEIVKLGFQCNGFTVHGQYLFFEYLP